MKCTSRRLFGLASLCLAVATGSSGLSRTAFAQDAITDSRYEELLLQLQPPSDEAWRTIPWKIDLLDAQRTAVAEQKPIFIWAMDGHPLGCT